ncbi:MAG TPA: TetR/AcrR family transcriptional regulator [Anaerolineales bacterium]|nr:TetR/AcrR family transcriptional regulator [Anaerolineales bacterium]
MPESKRQRGEATREAILQAAEATFAEHGFDGARVDTIAESSGYNKTLIFRYFGDKLGLYAAVLRRADREWSVLLGRVFLPLLEDESIVSDAHQFREFLRKTFAFFFDYMVDHPHFTRIINWEQAEGWQTFARIASQFEPDDLRQLEAIFSRAQKAGLLRTNLDIIVMILLIQQICWSSPNAFPMYQMLLAGKNFSPDAIPKYVRDQIIEFLLAGFIHDPKDHV